MTSFGLRLPEEELVCTECGWQGQAREAALTESGKHVKASCPRCDRYLKFVATGVPALYFGQYRNVSVDEVARRDPRYLAWLIGPSGPKRVGPGLRVAIEQALQALEQQQPD